MRLLPFALALACLPLGAQSTYVVDASGNTGQFKKIMDAVRAAKDRDAIHIKKGRYQEKVEIIGKSLSLIGIAASPKDVEIVQPAGTLRETIAIWNHPKARISRITRLTVRRSTPSTSVSIYHSGGNIIFDEVDMDMPFTIYQHLDGMVSVSRSKIASGYVSVLTDGVKNLFLHDCEMVNPGKAITLALAPGAQFVDTNVEISHCRIRGADGQPVSPSTATDGSPGIVLSSSTLRISGLPGNVIEGGLGTSTNPKSQGGDGVLATKNSRVFWSGATIRGGSGGAGSGIPIRTESGSTASQVQPGAVVITMDRSFARNQISTTTVHAAPNAQSISYAAIDFQLFPSIWGILAIDLSKPAFIETMSHDANGRASFRTDLRGLPATFVGAPFVIQSFAVDSQSRFTTSSPRFGVIGY